MSTTIRTHYDNLQVTRTASDEVIRGAYRYLCQKWHPDKHPHDREKAERTTKLLNEAYRVLSDPDRRRQHDEWIAAQEIAADSHTSRRAHDADRAANAQEPSSGSTQQADTFEREALEIHARYAVRGPVMRLWFMVLLVAAVLLLLLLLIVGVPRALHATSGVIARLCLLLVSFIQLAFLGTLCVYCYAKLFAPDPKSPDWILEPLILLGAASAKDWFKAAFGVLVWCGIFAAIGEHFDAQAMPKKQEQTSASSPGDTTSSNHPTRATSLPNAEQTLEDLVTAYRAGDYRLSGAGFRKLADEGNLAAAAYLCDAAVLGNGTPKTRIVDKRCVAAANAGIPLAMGIVAQDLLVAGKDIARGTKLAEAAARAGDARSIRLLGHLRYFGIGMAVDQAAAAPYYRRAVELGDIGAMSSLGFMYVLGEGTPRDVAAGISLLSKAVEKDLPDAQYAMSLILMYGPEELRDIPTAIRHLERAADQGLAPARLELARRLITGDGLRENYPRAAKLLDANIVSPDQPSREVTDRSMLMKAELVQLSGEEISASDWRETIELLRKAKNSPIADIAKVAAERLSSVTPVSRSDLPDIPTRFGTLAWSNDRELLFRTIPVRPMVELDEPALETPVAIFELQDEDVVLLQQGRGNSCPGMFVFVAVSALKARATPPFGTCYDETPSPTQSSGVVSFTLPDQTGGRRVRYSYHEGSVFADGKRVQ